MKKIVPLLLILLTTFLFSNCSSVKFNNESKKIDEIITKWHIDAKNANFETYFNRISKDGFYIGTDASEVWTQKEFKAYSKPYFDKKETWNFKALERNIYFSKSNEVAWFNEVLITWMGKCRGSGILERINDEWKIKQYVLSVTVPNNKMKQIIAIKK